MQECIKAGGDITPEECQSYLEKRDQVRNQEEYLMQNMEGGKEVIEKLQGIITHEDDEVYKEACKMVTEAYKEAELPKWDNTKSGFANREQLLQRMQQVVAKEKDMQYKGLKIGPKLRENNDMMQQYPVASWNVGKKQITPMQSDRKLER